MCNRSFSLLKQLLPLLYGLCTLLLSAETGVDAAAQKLAEKAFMQKTEAAVRHVFEQGLYTLPSAHVQVQALTLLAVYEAYNGSYIQAAAHYRQAAALNTNTAAKTELLLEAVRMLLCGSSFDSARSLLSEIAAGLPVNPENAQYRTAAVYDTWRLLAEDHADRALPLITAYSTHKAFSDYHPALLFTLWWVNGDEKAKARLLKEYPSGIEAAAVQGNVMIQPSSFWYLMPKVRMQQASSHTDSAMTFTAQQSSRSAFSNQSESLHTGVAAASSSGTATHRSVADTAQAKALYYQLGFYKTKQYAERLAADLQKKQFHPIIKEETRPSGTVYFAVLIEENAAGDIMLRLKDAGYEAFPVFP